MQQKGAIARPFLPPLGSWLMVPVPVALPAVRLAALVAASLMLRLACTVRGGRAVLVVGRAAAAAAASWVTSGSRINDAGAAQDEGKCRHDGCQTALHE